MNYKIDLLPAEEGDCIVVTWPEGVMVIDGGRQATWTHLKARLTQLHEEGRTQVDLLVISHIDRDHIEGILTLVEDPKCPIAIKEIWFNGYHHLTGLEPMGGVQGERLSHYLYGVKERWNTCLEGRAIIRENATVSIELPGGMKLYLLSPTQKQLTELAPKWEAECQKKGMIAGKMHEDEIVPTGLEVLGSVDVDLLAMTKFSEDNAIPNGSSIAFVAEYQKYRVLFGADAFPSVLLDGLKDWFPNESKVQLDALKVSHHGSKNNTSPEFLAAIDCPRFLISTNGSHFSHPDKEAIAWILKSREQKELYFNYSSNQTKIWRDAGLQDNHNFQAFYPPEDKQSGIVIEFPLSVL